MNEKKLAEAIMRIDRIHGGVSVIVSDEQSVKFLWEKGWFGKGSGSRGKPKCCSNQQETASYKPARAFGRRNGKTHEEALSLNIVAATTTTTSTSWSSPTTNDEEEIVVLSHFEAFYLTFIQKWLKLTLVDTQEGTEMVTIINEGNNEDKQKCWNLFCTENERFPELICVYIHFRKLGWAPRSGLSHGVDFLLYRPGQIHHHAPFSVLIESNSNSSSSNLSFSRLCHTSRNMVSVAKNLLLCCIKFPSNQSASTSNTKQQISYNCMFEFEIHQVTFTRWVPDQNRQ